MSAPAVSSRWLKADGTRKGSDRQWVNLRDWRKRLDGGQCCVLEEDAGSKEFVRCERREAAGDEVHVHHLDDSAPVHVPVTGLRTVCKQHHSQLSAGVEFAFAGGDVVFT